MSAGAVQARRGHRVHVCFDWSRLDVDVRCALPIEMLAEASADVTPSGDAVQSACALAGVCRRTLLSATTWRPIAVHDAR